MLICCIDNRPSTSTRRDAHHSRNPGQPHSTTTAATISRPPVPSSPRKIARGRPISPKKMSPNKSRAPPAGEVRTIPANPILDELFADDRQPHTRDRSTLLQDLFTESQEGSSREQRPTPLLSNGQHQDHNQHQHENLSDRRARLVEDTESLTSISDDEPPSKRRRYRDQDQAHPALVSGSGTGTGVGTGATPAGERQASIPSTMEPVGPAHRIMLKIKRPTASASSSPAPSDSMNPASSPHGPGIMRDGNGNGNGNGNGHGPALNKDGPSPRTPRVAELQGRQRQQLEQRTPRSNEDEMTIDDIL